MSKIEALIQKLCPDGVPSVRLGEVCFLSRGKVYSKKYLVEHAGDYPVYSSQTANNGMLGKIDTYDYNGTYLTWTTDGAYAGTVFYRQGKFSITNVCGLISCNNTALNLRFLYYWLTVEAPNYVYAGMGNPKLMSNQMSNVVIPLPPLAVQEEVVRILDKFSALEAELEAELEARKKQYEHYRNHLLNFSDNPNVKWVKLGEVAFYVKERVNAAELDENTYIGVENLLKDKLGRTDSTVVPQGSVIQFKPKDILIGNIRPYLRKIWKADCMGGTNGDVLCIRAKNESELAPDYLFHVLASERFFTYDMQNSKGAKMPRGDKSAVMDFEIPIPSLSEQERIVGILDRFEALTTSLQEGLPAEIDARRKQYEYYRDRLLEFKIKN